MTCQRAVGEATGREQETRKRVQELEQQVADLQGRLAVQQLKTVYFEIGAQLAPARKVDDGDIARGVSCLGNRCTVKATLIDSVLANPKGLLADAPFAPTSQDGRPIGFSLWEIRPGSIFDRLGFQNGDVPRAANGIALDSPENILSAFRQIYGHSRKIVLDVDVQRQRGVPIKREYRIAP
jgi:hypothetical protein